MQYEFLEYLVCPLSKTKLRFKLISEFTKSYADGDKKEIENGLLYSETGFVFPIIDGIPRMLIESIYDYKEFLSQHVPNYETVLLKIENEHTAVLQYCQKKNTKTKESFAFEWSFLNPEKNDKLWHYDSAELVDLFTNEFGESREEFTTALVADIGSGHGLMTSSIASISKTCIGAEISKAVEMAYRRNKQSNAWYAQADLQYLPFAESSFDFLYSSGVIHHTNDTKNSLLLIEPILKSKGKICLWLYHPQNNFIHNAMMGLRKFTKRLPLKVNFYFLLVFIYPISFITKRLKNKPAPNFREEMIDLLDGFSPEFRFEIPYEEARNWLQELNYSDMKKTTTNQYGYSIVGKKEGL